MVDVEGMDHRGAKETGEHQAPMDNREALVLKEDPGKGASQVYLGQPVQWDSGVPQDIGVPLV